jgi:hypothetical protein
MASYDAAVPAALVIAGDSRAEAEAAQAVAIAGCRLQAVLPLAEAAQALGRAHVPDLLLIEAAAAPDALFDLVLARADTLARERPLAVLLAIRPDQIDAAAAQLFAPGAQLLCEPSMAERVAAIGAAKWRARGQLNDASREPESLRLQRLNQEVARIADALARLTRDEPAASGGLAVRSPNSGYRTDPGGGADADVADTSAVEVRNAIRARRMRAQFFAAGLFADPAWDMLLDLFAARLEQRAVSVSSLCIAAAVPPTTALRWIGTLHDAGLFERQADPSDRRRAHIALTAAGLAGMQAYARAVKRAGLPLA